MSRAPNNDGDPYEPVGISWMRKIETADKISARISSLRPYRRYKKRLLGLNLTEELTEERKARGRLWPSGSNEHFAWTRNQIFNGYSFPAPLLANKNTKLNVFDIPTDKGSSGYATRMPNELYVVTGGVDPKRTELGRPSLVKYDTRAYNQLFRVPLPLDAKSDRSYYASVVVHENGRIYVTTSRFLFEVIDELADKIFVNRYEWYDRGIPSQLYTSGLVVTPEGYVAVSSRFIGDDCNAFGARHIQECGVSNIPSSMMIFIPDKGADYSIEYSKNMLSIELPGAGVGAISGAIEGGVSCLYQCLKDRVCRVKVNSDKSLKPSLAIDENWTPSYETDQPVSVVTQLGQYMVGTTNSRYTKKRAMDVVIIPREEKGEATQVTVGEGGPSWFPAKSTCDSDTMRIYISDGLVPVISCYEVDDSNPNRPTLTKKWSVKKRTGSSMSLTGPPTKRQLLHSELSYPSWIVTFLIILYLLLGTSVALLYHFNKYKSTPLGIFFWVLSILMFAFICLLTTEATCARFTHVFGGELTYAVPREEWAVWRNAETGRVIKRVKVKSGVALGIQPLGGNQFIYSAIFDKSVTLIEMD